MTWPGELFRKHGDDWRAESADAAHARLRSWGMNTIGNWSDQTVRLQRRTPYVDSISSGRARRLEGSQGYRGKFPDPFDASFRTEVKASMAAKAGKSANEPWCIGYFSDNEIAWGDDLSLSVAALESPSDQPAKLASDWSTLPTRLIQKRSRLFEKSASSPARRGRKVQHRSGFEHCCARGRAHSSRN